MDGDLVIDGDLFIPTGSMTSQVVQKVASTDNAVVRFDGTTGKLQNSAITIDDSGNIGSGNQTFNGFGGSGFKNYIINGNFDVWQYGTSQTCTSAAFQYGSVDRFCLINTEATNYTISRVSVDGTEPFSANYFVRNVVPLNTTSGLVFDQHIENLKRFSNKTVTLSMWVKGAAGKKIGFGYQTNYGSGGTPSPLSNILGKIFILTGAWQKVVMTTTLPDVITGKTYGTNDDSLLRLSILFSSGTTSLVPEIFFQSGTFDIAQVQLEEGSVATPFENRPYGLELSLCQRYYQTNLRSGYTYALSGTTSAWRTTIPLLQPMRMAPTSFGFNGAIIFQGNTGGNTLGTIGTTYNQINCIQFDGSFTANNGNNTGTEPMVANGGYFWASAEL